MNLDFVNGLSKLMLSTAVLLASASAFVFSMNNAGALQATAVHLGMNPVVSFYCYSTNNTYTVPTGSDLIITDITSPDYLQIRADGSNIWTHFANYSNTSKHYALSTGFVAPSGTVVSCASGSGYIAGYLVKS